MYKYRLVCKDFPNINTLPYLTSASTARKKGFNNDSRTTTTTTTTITTTTTTTARARMGQSFLTEISGTAQK
jgi:hypothetical protein